MIDYPLGMETPRRRTWSELVQVPEPLLPTFQKWARGATNPVEVLPPNPNPADREEAIVAVQASRDSLLGTLAWDTGGMLVDHGFIRVLGSGHPRLGSSFATWNRQSLGVLFVAFDAIGGMFVINDGGLSGVEVGHVAYFAPDTLTWVPMKVDFGQWMLWAINGSTDEFYGAIRWTSWKRDVSMLPGTMGWRFEPPLHEPAPPGGRRLVPSPMQALLAIQLSHLMRARAPTITR